MGGFLGLSLPLLFSGLLLGGGGMPGGGGPGRAGAGGLGGLGQGRGGAAGRGGYAAQGTAWHGDNLNLNFTRSPSTRTLNTKAPGMYSSDISVPRMPRGLANASARSGQN